MDLAPLGLAIHVCGAVFFVFGVGKIIDHLAQGLRVGRRCIRLQVDGSVGIRERLVPQGFL